MAKESKPRPIPARTTIGGLKASLELLAKSVRENVTGLARSISRDLAGLHNRLLVLERANAVFSNGAKDQICGCGHTRGMHADQNADGPCQSKIIVGNPADPMGERKYAPCICERFSTLAIR